MDAETEGEESRKDFHYKLPKDLRIISVGANNIRIYMERDSIVQIFLSLSLTI